MKKIFLITILFWVAMGVKCQTLSNKFIIRGKVIGKSTWTVYLVYTDRDGRPIQDYAPVKDGGFTFKGSISVPTRAFLLGEVDSINLEAPNSIEFFMEPSTITITLKINDFKNAVITGSRSQEEFAALKKRHEPIIKQMQPLEDSVAKADEEYEKAKENHADETTLDSMNEKIGVLHGQFVPYHQQIANSDYQFFAEHPNSFVTAYCLSDYISSLSLDSLQMFYVNLGTLVQQSNSGKNIAREIEKIHAGSVGSIAKDFSSRDINGKKLALFGFRGRYVLLDFWASWCVPCRHSNPHLLDLYIQYHSKGLEIIGIADDDSHPDEWKKAVAKDNIGAWYHVLRGFEWKRIQNGEENPNDIDNKFGIHSLPTKILVDKSGAIIGRYDLGTNEEVAAIDEQIAELLK